MEFRGDYEGAVTLASQLLEFVDVDPHWRAANLSMAGRQKALLASQMSDARPKFALLDEATLHLMEARELLSSGARQDIFSVTTEVSWGILLEVAGDHASAIVHATRADEILDRVGAANPNLVRLRAMLGPDSEGSDGGVLVAKVRALDRLSQDPAAAYLALFQGLEELLSATAVVLSDRPPSRPLGAMALYRTASDALAKLDIDVRSAMSEGELREFARLRNILVHTSARSAGQIDLAGSQALLGCIREVERMVPKEVLSEATRRSVARTQ